MMEPQLVSWHEKWSKQGLVIIEIDNGQIDSLDEVETHVADRNIPFTVLHDKGGLSATGTRSGPIRRLI